MATREKPVRLQFRAGYPRRVSILIVDGHRGVSELIRRNIETSGIRVFEAATGIDGIRLLGEHTIDLLLLDPSLPDVDVQVFLNRCRHLYPGEGLPRIIFMSDEPPDRLLMRRFNIETCVPKPFDMRDLMERIERVFKPDSVKPGASN